MAAKRTAGSATTPPRDKPSLLVHKTKQETESGECVGVQWAINTASGITRAILGTRPHVGNMQTPLSAAARRVSEQAEDVGESHVCMPSVVPFSLPSNPQVPLSSAAKCVLTLFRDGSPHDVSENGNR